MSIVFKGPLLTRRVACSLARRPAPARIEVAVWWPPICWRTLSCGRSGGSIALPLLLVLLIQRPGMLGVVGMLMGKGCCPHPCCGLLPLQRLLRRPLHPASGIRVRVCPRGRQLLLRRLRWRLLRAADVPLGIARSS